MESNISGWLEQLGARYKSGIGIVLAANVTMLFVVSLEHDPEKGNEAGEGSRE